MKRKNFLKALISIPLFPSLLKTKEPPLSGNYTLTQVGDASHPWILQRNDRAVEKQLSMKVPKFNMLSIFRELR